MIETNLLGRPSQMKKLWTTSSRMSKPPSRRPKTRLLPLVSNLCPSNPPLLEELRGGQGVTEIRELTGLIRRRGKSIVKALETEIKIESGIEKRRKKKEMKKKIEMKGGIDHPQTDPIGRREEIEEEKIALEIVIEREGREKEVDGIPEETMRNQAEAGIVLVREKIEGGGEALEGTGEGIDAEEIRRREEGEETLLREGATTSKITRITALRSLAPAPLL